MTAFLKGRSFLTLKDFSIQEIRQLLDLSHQVKREKKEGLIQQRFMGKTLAMIFEKSSTRTRSAFETAFGEEGGHPVFLSKSDIQLGAKETLEDTARVLGRMFDAIQFRGFKQETVETLAQYSGVPVYNGLTDIYHPTQVLADLMTLEENFGSLQGKKMVYAGDGRNNMAHSLMLGCAKMGVNLIIASPEPLYPLPYFVEQAQLLARETGVTIEVQSDLKKAAVGADALYTDVWASMGEEAQIHLRKVILKPFQINQEIMELTGLDSSIFLHCLPAVRGNEVTEEVLEGPQSRVWDQAENRKHTIKALMLSTL